MSETTAPRPNDADGVELPPKPHHCASRAAAALAEAAKSDATRSGALVNVAKAWMELGLVIGLNAFMGAPPPVDDDRR